MTAGEITVLAITMLFTIAVIFVCLGFDLKKFFKWLLGSKKTKEKKEKKSKPKKEKKVKEKKTKTIIKEETKKEEPKEEKKEPEKKPRAFSITKKGVARIHKKAIERDSRSGAIIEQAIKKGEKIGDDKQKDEDVGFNNFDDLLEKLNNIGDPDELDDETFKKLFMSNSKNKSLFDDDAPEDDGFISSESPETGRIDRRLKHFTIDGKHLNLDKRYDDYPSRMPTLDMDHFVFTDRITGKYDNIKMGDVSNILKPPEPDNNSDNDEQENTSTDEEIFAKIMDRRRREMGLDSSKQNADDKPKDYLDPTTLIIADAIATPKFKQSKNNKD